MWTLLDGARTILAESGLPIKYWTEVVQTITYIRNFIPTARQPRQVPAEIWHGQWQDIDGDR